MTEQAYLHHLGGDLQTKGLGHWIVRELGLLIDSFLDEGSALMWILCGGLDHLRCLPVI